MIGMATREQDLERILQQGIEGLDETIRDIDRTLGRAGSDVKEQVEIIRDDLLKAFRS